MHRLLTLIALLFVTSVHAQAPSLANEILGSLAKHPQVRAEFSQSRENPALAEPQVSKGDLLFVIGHGMVWHTRDPFEDTLVLTSGDTRRLNAQGKLERVRDGNRGVSQVSGMLQSLLAGKSEEAARQFTITADGSIDRWTLTFVPRQARVARVLAGITLKGDAFLESIEVNLASGERTLITFTNTRDADSLTPVEAKVLGVP
ncbi:MAG: outer membrane lipoprotein carrier protein LolA [Luteibacter sp.]|jgi:outer membrane lipoprotein-sorting protein|uniref:LolA family protein n=1 Tax=unclassified Luteibacter TaxID=2620188 RepID=UPI0005B77D09|nr:MULTISPECIES: outer membrane lipoprotein carrier protein LolA [unclassified Luteibacter]MDQ7996024.1 outer membrane lipoprotein carrier protein LolA [Luteibacter sp.]MDQ8048789.1 outer membrane lipoprotein carrier protein LolA [Luteibacter sp.]MDR6643969.1 outer membrane lipoprotein-sorting protein [Luteibacter sp. 1214]